MRKLAVVVVALLAVGCGKKKDTKENAGPVGPVAKMEGFKTEMCGCKDKDCVDKVNRDVKQFGEDNKLKKGNGPMPTEAEMKRMTEIGQEIGQCMRKAMGARTPDPAGGSAGSGSAPAGSGG